MSLLSLLACSLLALPALVAGSPLPPPLSYFRRNPITRREINDATVRRELGPLLSNGTLMYGPEQTAFDTMTERWNRFVEPDVRVVVVPFVESDVAKIVRYCNENSIDFLVKNRGHGFTTSLNSFSGLQINMERLAGITISEDKTTVLLQGGVYAGPVIEALWDEGYITTTGSAACVGVLGPSLGGGHGRHEGLYGLVSDTILHFNVVLADGTAVGVNATSNEDLFWALQGAGHNFAIVTSIVKTIYPRQSPTWYTHSFVFSQDKLETIFELLNEFHTSDNGTLPPLMGATYSSFAMNPSFSETEAVISVGFDYNGPAEEALAMIQPFTEIESLQESGRDVTFPEISGVAAGSCGGADYILSSAMLLEYNITTERLLYNHFNEKVAANPELGATAFLLHEGYATAGIKAIDPASTAYGHREENFIMLFETIVPEGSDLAEPATQWAKESVDIWNAGQPDRLPSTYVNYATGNEWETVESVYGHEEWRLQRLVDLKAKYDPLNRFRYYVPIEASP
ncbi:hypothetical protein B0I35DRAFT_468063 [Stachybotrys elegans]|uniref:FAD-binding PCMH-type domain-containing protein n=1 Tax=Stachybotrys elegans TaxID=80388 RepID=A0A8K0WTD5_9HYPO|nr:hypothetical protein B0I35DRAFT_468063 [Stachybotrys elegans]